MTYHGAIFDDHIIGAVIDDTCVCTQGHAYKLYLRSNCLDVLHYFFSERVTKIWNSLPAKSEHFSSLARSKNFIRSRAVQRLIF